MAAVCAVILAYTLALLFIILPSVENSTRALEEKNGREILSKVSMIARNMQANLENFRSIALEYHKTELKDLTDAFWSIAEAKYEQSRPENIGSILARRGRELERNLMRFYENNKGTMGEEELKQAIISYVRIYRYDNGSGYFFIHRGTTVVEHPLYPEFRGRDFDYLHDGNGVYFVRQFYRQCREHGSGIVFYQWKHARTKVMEDKVAYVFTFAPFDWIIGTTASIRELQEQLRDDVIYLADRVRFGDNNFFFITDYDYRVISHPFYKKGTDFSLVRDTTGKAVVPEMTRIARENGEGFTRYWWKPKGGPGMPREKLSFIKDFPDWKMVIGTGTFIDDIQREVDRQRQTLLQQLRAIVQQTRIGTSGYLYIVDAQGTIIIHPDPDIEGTNVINLALPGTDTTIFDGLKRAAETGESMYYTWDRPDDPGNFNYDKISWVEYLPGLQWYVATSAYASELQETSARLKKGILLLGFSILLLAFLVSFFFFRKLFRPVSDLAALAGRVTRGDYSARSPYRGNDEIGVLSREFNTMVDTIEDNIRHLDRKVAEKTREAERESMFFQTLFYESSDGILLIKNEMFADCNRSAYRMLGYDSKEELITIHPSAISPPTQPDGQDSAAKADAMIATAREKGSNRFEWVHLRRDGSKTHLEVVLTRVTIQDEIFIHVVWRDINEKKAAERQLQKTLNEFSAVMEAIDYGVLFMDNRLRARIANRAFREIWNVPEEFVATHPTMRELMAHNRHASLYKVPDEEFEDYMTKREEDVRRGAIGPTTFTRRDGMVLQYQCVVLPDGWRMLTYFDITELKKTQERLARAQKMEAIGMMAGGVAHDLNNILAGIVGYPELLLAQLPADSPLRKPLEAIHESGKRAATVVADLLTVARSAASTMEPRDINILIQEYLHSPEFEKLCTLHPYVECIPRLEATDTVISCSPVHIKKVLMNLVTNAVEAIQTSGRVHIATENLVVRTGRQGPGGIGGGHYVVITISDNGPGIAEKDIGRIFEPFYSNKVMGRSGTGLGLTVVWNTVEDHGGRITVTSSDKGTCFKLYFPLSSEQSAPDPEQRPARTEGGRGEHILVVDDEPQLRDIAARMLTGLGYRVSTAASGEEAVDFVRKTPVDLILIDMLMEPGINGRQTYEQIRRFRPDQKAVIASGFSESEDIRQTLRLGARGFIKKPYTMDQLAAAVEDALKN
jgi:PAS domain S-box-containing protein